MEAQSYIDLRKSLEVEESKQVLRRRGYFVEGLWRVINITSNYHCTEEEAHQIIADAFSNEETIKQIWKAIREAADKINVKQI